MNDKDKDIVCILGLLLSPVLLGYVLPNIVFGEKSPKPILSNDSMINHNELK